MKLKALFFIFSMVFLTTGITNAEETKKEVEIGIVEHLGETMPLDVWFLDENNDTVVLRDLMDKPTIFSFVYFDCPGICSPLMSGLEEVIDRSDLKLGVDYQVITISFNTRDTPMKAKEKKKNFVAKFKSEDQKNWFFMTGTKENIDKVTNAAGFKYKAQGMDFAHPGALIMTSPQGKITRYLYGIQFNQFDVKMAVFEAQKGIERPTISKVLNYCFSYDSQSQTYRLQITRIVASLTLIIAIPFLIFLFIRNKRNKISKPE